MLIEFMYMILILALVGIGLVGVNRNV